MTNKQSLILVRGAPGFGKSTFAEKLCTVRPEVLHVEADQYFTRPDGVYDWNPKLLHQAHGWCLKMTEAALNHGNSVVVANCFQKIWQMDNYKKLAALCDVEFVVVQMTKRYKNIHGVSPERVGEILRHWEETPQNYADVVLTAIDIPADV